MSIRPWLDRAGSFVVEHVPCDTHFHQLADLHAPPAGVGHTTEGPTLESALGIFKQHYAPQFLLGKDKSGKIRILQLVAVGMIGAALEQHNALALVQVEVVGFSQERLWRPDEETAEAFASLMAACKAEYGIPLD